MRWILLKMENLNHNQSIIEVSKKIIAVLALLQNQKEVALINRIQ